MDRAKGRVGFGMSLEVPHLTPQPELLPSPTTSSRRPNPRTAAQLRLPSRRLRLAPATASPAARPRPCLSRPRPPPPAPYLLPSPILRPTARYPPPRARRLPPLPLRARRLRRRPPPRSPPRQPAPLPRAQPPPRAPPPPPQSRSPPYPLPSVLRRRLLPQPSAQLRRRAPRIKHPPFPSLPDPRHPQIPTPSTLLPSPHSCHNPFGPNERLRLSRGRVPQEYNRQRIEAEIDQRQCQPKSPIAAPRHHSPLRLAGASAPPVRRRRWKRKGQPAWERSARLEASTGPVSSAIVTFCYKSFCMSICSTQNCLALMRSAHCWRGCCFFCQCAR